VCDLFRSRRMAFEGDCENWRSFVMIDWRSCNEPFAASMAMRSVCWEDTNSPFRRSVPGRAETFTAVTFKFLLTLRSLGSPSPPNFNLPSPSKTPLSRLVRAVQRLQMLLPGFCVTKQTDSPPFSTITSSYFLLFTTLSIAVKVISQSSPPHTSHPRSLDIFILTTPTSPRLPEPLKTSERCI
jgi:hypothetical protein